jgi:Domain of unknown function (DUF6504)
MSLRHGVATRRPVRQDAAMPERFVSGPLTPDPNAIDPTGMDAGVPGLPRRFTWDGRVHEVARVVARWREAGPERGRRGPAADTYLRRHWWRVVTAEGLDLKIYCERQTRGRGTGGPGARQRWWVYSVTEGD